MASNLIKFVFKHKFIEDDTISDGNNSQDDCTSRPTSIFVLGKLSDSKFKIFFFKYSPILYHLFNKIVLNNAYKLNKQ